MSTHKILVLVELAGSEPDDSALELASEARRLCGGGTVAAALTGSGLGDLPAQLTPWFDTVHVFDDDQLGVPDGSI